MTSDAEVTPLTVDRLAWPRTRWPSAKATTPVGFKEAEETTAVSVTDWPGKGEATEEDSVVVVATDVIVRVPGT